MDIDIFKPNGSDLDAKIEALVAKRLLEGLDADEQLELDRLVAQRASRLLPTRRHAPPRYVRVA